MTPLDSVCTYSQFPPRNDRLKSIQFNSPATQDKTRVLKDTAHFPGVIPYNKRRHHLYRLPYIPIPFTLTSIHRCEKAPSESY